MHENIKKRITVVMSVLNGERYLEQSIESIISQTYEDFDFIIINDGSSDKSWDIITDFSIRDARIIPINQKNIGLTASLEKALNLCNSDYIARQDADDYSFPSRLRKQIDFMDKNPNVALLGSGAVIVDEDSKKTILYGEQNYELLSWEMLFSNCFIHSSCMMRLSSLKSVKLNYGTIPHEYQKFAKAMSPYGPSQDYLLFGLLARYFSIAQLYEPLVVFRKHRKSISFKDINQQNARRDEISKLLVSCHLGYEINTSLVNEVRNYKFFGKEISSEGKNLLFKILNKTWNHINYQTSLNVVSRSNFIYGPLNKVIGSMLKLNFNLKRHDLKLIYFYIRGLFKSGK